MMMAHDSSPGGAGSLSPETIEIVRAELLRYVSVPEQGDALGRALRVMAAEARERAILPEQLLILLKDIWYTLPIVRAIREPSDQVRLLQRVITMCIREYYSG